MAKYYSPKTPAIFNKRSIPSLSKLKDEYLAFKGGTIGRGQRFEYKNAVNKLILSLGDLPITNYNKLSLGIFRSKQLESQSWNTVAKTMRTLSALFSYAASEYEIVNPLLALKLKQKINEPRVYSLDELTRFLKKAYEINTPFYSQVMFLLLTGMRVSESCKIQWSQINFERRCINYDNIKGNRNELFPMDSAIEDLLGTLSREFSPHIFKYRSRERMAEVFRKVAPMALISTELTLHNLKKTFSTLLADSNAPAHITQKLSHHADIKTTLNYYVFKKMESERSALATSRDPIRHLLPRAQ